MNVLKALGIQNKEDPNTNLLAFCFNESSSFREIFLDTVCGIRASWKSGKARTRVQIQGSGIPDLVIVCKGEQRDCLVILENKLDADEGKGQTERYSSSECIGKLMDKFDLLEERTDKHYVFFTRYPDQRPAAETPFRQVCHLKLAQALDAFDPSRSPNEVSVLAHSWADLTKQIHKAGEIYDTDIVLERLRTQEPEAGNYLYFRTLFKEGIDLPSGMEVTRIYKQSQKGRRYFGAIISKPHWHPYEMHRDGGSFRMDSGSFHIHLEPQFNHLNGSLDLRVHYEVYPYRTEPWVRQNVRSSDYEAYVDHRNKFAKVLKERSSGSFIFRGGSNQIAVMSLSYLGSQIYPRFKSQMEEVLTEIMKDIDDALNSLEQ